MTTIPKKEGGAAQEEGVLNSNEGVGEERSALRGHLQVRQGCVPPCLMGQSLTVTKYSATHSTPAPQGGREEEEAGHRHEPQADTLD